MWVVVVGGGVQLKSGTEKLGRGRGRLKEITRILDGDGSHGDWEDYGSWEYDGK